MKQILIMIGFMTILAVAIGRSTVEMTQIGSEYISPALAKCHYQKSTTGQMRVSILFEGSQYRCPDKIRYDLESGLWE